MKFVDGWKRKMKANIGKCQEQWHSYMSELNERRHEFHLAAGDHDIRNKCVNGSEEEFECRNVWLGDTGESAHMIMVHSGFKSMVKGKVKTCFAVDGDAVKI